MKQISHDQVCTNHDLLSGGVFSAYARNSPLLRVLTYHIITLQWVIAVVVPKIYSKPNGPANLCQM